MPDFLFLDNVEMGDVDESTCLRIRAPDADAALRFLREQEANDPEYLEYLAERTVDIGAISRFCVVTDLERRAFETDGTVIASADTIASRIDAFFPSRSDWATIMRAYVLDDDLRIDGPEDIAALMPYEMRLYLVEHAPWRTFQIINLDAVRVLA